MVNIFNFSCSSAAVKVSGGSTYFFYGHLSTAQVNKSTSTSKCLSLSVLDKTLQNGRVILSKGGIYILHLEYQWGVYY